MKIAIKLPLIFIIYSLLTLSVIYGISLKSRDFLEQETMNAIKNEAELLTQLIDRNVFERYKDTQSFSLPDDVNSSNWYQLDKQQIVTERLNEIARNYRLYNHLVVFDKYGKVIAANTDNGFGKTVPSLTLGSQWVFEQPWFSAVLQGQSLSQSEMNGVYIYGPERSILRDWQEHYDLLFVKPIVDKQGNVIGVWANIVDFSVIESIVADTYLVLSHRGWISTSITLLDAQGNIIVDYDPVGQQSAMYKRDFTVLGQINLVNDGVAGARLAVAGLQGANISIHSRKKTEQVTGYAHSQGVYDYPGMNWSALIRINVDEAFKQAAFLQRMSLFIGVLLLLLILASALYVSFNFASPLRKIARIVVGLAHGQRQFTLPPVTANDEVGEMAQAVALLKEKLTERDTLFQQSQQQRQALDIQLRAIDATTSGLIITDMLGGEQPVIFVNRAFQRITGYHSDEVVGQNCRLLQGEDTDQAELTKLRQAIAKGVSCTVELRNYRKDGTQFLNQLRIDPVYNDANQLTHYIGVLNDVTDEKRQAEMTQFSLEKEIDRRTKQSRESENKLRAVFNSTRDGTIVMEGDGKIVDINHSGELIFGYKRQHVLDKDISLLIDDTQMVGINDGEGTLAYAISLHDSSALIKVVGIHKSGRKFPAELSIGINYLTDVDTYVISVRDITEQENVLDRERRLKEELVQNEELYRTAFNQAAIGMAHISPQRHFLKVNEKLCSILGYSEAELVTLRADDITYSKDMHITTPLIEQVISGQSKSFTVDKRYITKRGGLIWINLTMSLVRCNGEDDYFIAIFEDINERKTSETALKRAKAYQEELLLGLKLASDAGGICNWKYDLRTHEIDWDDNMYQLYGVPHGAKVDYHTWTTHLHPDDREQSEQVFLNAIEHKQTFRHTFRIVRPDGATRWIAASADMMLDEHGTPIKQFGINTDITADREIQDALARETRAANRANEAKSQFLAMMSHEIRTPMNGVVGMIDVLQQTALQKEQLRMVKTIKDSSLSLLHIINDVLDFSKIESGQMPLEINKTVLLNQIESTVEATWLCAKDSNVTLLIEHDFNVPHMLLLDAIRLRQILLNLVGNAIKFTANRYQHGYVWVRTQYCAEQQQLSLSVKDTGVGMTAEQMQNLFKPFTQADASTTRKYGGTGLGLSITKSFTELMGGEISVTSEPDKGSEFVITLPATIANDSDATDCPYDLAQRTVYLDIVDNELSASCRVMLASAGLILSDMSTAQVIITDQLTCKPTNEQQKLILLIDDPFEPLAGRTPYSYGISNYPLKPSELVFGLAVLFGIESPELSYHADKDKSSAKLKLNRHFTGTILCAEDQRTNQLVLSKQLERLGYQYLMTDNGEAALEAWKTGQFQVILTDCHMPVMDGFELTKAIRHAEQQQQQSPSLIIAITANVMAGEDVICKQAGMDDYIGKPVELSALSVVLDRYLNAIDDYQRENSVKQTDPVEQPTNAAIDMTYLEQMIGSENESLQHEVLEIFWTALQQDLHALKIAVKAQDWATIRSKAHGAKGASASTGALALSQLFNQLEREFDQAAVVVELLAQIELAVVQVQQQLCQIGILSSPLPTEIGEQ
ncbi:PAS domain S-box protein [Shewanella sp. A3A]|nr:PAS domain S-box protein [Shewanella ferrihydritica]